MPEVGLSFGTGVIVPERGFTVRALGEIAIRCNDLEAMTAFYRDVIGLEPMADRGGIRFFQLDESYGGHTAVLALFEAEVAPETGTASSLHHLALTVDVAEQSAIVDWYENQGIAYRIENFTWIGWRGIFTEDPEGNTVELVAKVGEAKGA